MNAPSFLRTLPDGASLGYALGDYLNYNGVSFNPKRWKQ